MAEERNLVFVLSPNAGILDSWLPVLDRLARMPKVRIHALLPRPRATLNLRQDDFMVRNAARIFASAHFCTSDGRWARARNLVQARRKLVLSNRAHSLVDSLTRTPNRRFQEDPTIDEESTRRYLERMGLHRAEAMFCDISESHKPYFTGLLQATPQTRIHSVSQGISLRETGDGPSHSVESTFPPQIRDRIETQFLMSSSEMAHYGPKYGLSPHQTCISGIFRHDPGWHQRMRQPGSIPGPEPGSYVFLASRPASARYLPRVEKQRVICMVHEQARKRGLSLAIRRHPFEGNKRELERLIGKPGARNQWFETARHPMDVGADCALAVTLNSSVAIDMAAIGVPVIEPIDYAGYRRDAPNVRLDDNGRQVSIYSKSGVAIGASTETDFASAMDQLLAPGQPSRLGASAAYRALYADPTGSIDEAVSRILE